MFYNLFNSLGQTLPSKIFYYFAIGGLLLKPYFAKNNFIKWL